MKRYILFTIFYFIISTLFSQFNFDTKFAYVYEIKDPNMNLYNSKVIDLYLKKYDYVVPFDTIDVEKVDSFKIKNRHPYPLLIKYVHEFNLIVEWSCYFPWNVEPVYYPNYKAIKVTDVNGNNYKGLTIKNGLEKLTYDSVYGIYYFENSIDENISISNDTIQQIYNYSKRNYHRSYHSENDDLVFPEYQALIITNKPKYKIGDTLKVKVYAFNENGKQMRDSLRIEICDEYYNTNYKYSAYKKYYTTKKSPTTPGAYLFEYIVSDSLKIDKTYQIRAYRNNTKKELGRNTIYVEEYKLDEITYNIRGLKTDYYQNDSLYFEFTATDENNKPVYDAKFKYTITPNYLYNKYTSSVRVPTIIASGEIFFNETKGGVFQFPNKLKNLPCDYSCNIDVEFSNSNNEIYRKTINTTIYYSNRPFEYYIYNTTLKFNSLITNCDSIMIHSFDQNKKLFYSKKISIHDSIILSPNIKNYLFTYNDYQLHLNNEASMYAHDVIGDIKNDTLFLFKNQHKDIPVHWYYKLEDDLVKLNSDVNSIKLPIKADNPIEIIWTYQFLGERYYESQKYYIDSKSIHIKHTIPTKVYPSEEKNIEISTQNYKGKLLKNTNLTVISINAAFESDNIPSVYNFNQLDLKRTNFTPNYWLDEKQLASYTRRVNLEDINAFHLQSQEAYKFILDKSNIYKYYVKNESVTTNGYAIIKFCNKKTVYFYEPLYILENEKIVFHSSGNLDFVYGNEGKHNYMIGYNRKLSINLNNIELKKDSILFIVIDDEKIKTKDYLVRTNYSLGDVDSLLKKTFFKISNSSYEPYFIETPDWTMDKTNVQYCKFIGPVDKSEPTKIYNIINNNLSCIYNNNNPMYLNLKETYCENLKWRYEYSSYRGSDYKLVSYYTNQIKTTFRTVNEWFAANNKVNYLKDFHDKLPNSSNSSSVHFIFDDDTKKHDAYILKDLKVDTTYKILGHVNYLFLNPSLYHISFVNNKGELIVQDTFEVSSNYVYYKEMIKNDTSLLELEKNTASHGLTGYFELKIVDENNEPIPFASIISADRTKGYQTDLNGVLNMKYDDLYTIKEFYVNSIGYEKLKVKSIDILNSNKIIKLKQSLLELNEVQIQDRSSGAHFHRYRSKKEVNRTVETSEEQIFIDGVKLASVAASDDVISAVTITSGVVASYGDVNRLFSFNSNIEKSTFNGSRGKLDPSDNFMDLNLFDPKINRIRSVFTDNAIWEPNLITDEQGKATFKVKFPDNITSWNTAILAMHPKGYSGDIRVNTKSYKPVVASLYLPDFVIEGDSFEVINKVMNYSEVQLKTKLKLELNNYGLYHTDTTIGQYSYTNYMSYAKNFGDTMKFRFSTTLENNYFDGEERNVIVKEKGIEYHRGVFLPVWSDTILDLDKYSYETFEIFDGLAGIVEKEANYIVFKYMHGCNEQMSSKLISAICAHSISNNDFNKFRYKSQILSMIDKLTKNQNSEGGWSWWNKGTTDVFMTFRVVEALHFAIENGFEVKLKVDLREVINRIPLDYMSIENKLSYYYIKAKLNANGEFYPLDLTSIEKEISQQQNSYYDLQLIGIKQLCKQNYSLDKLWKSKNETLFGNYYWGDDSYNMYSNSINCSLLALKIVESENITMDTLARIIGFLMEKRQNDHFSNTIASANVSMFIHNYLKKHAKTSTEINYLDKTIKLNQPLTKIDEKSKIGKVSIKTDNLIFLSLYKKEKLKLDTSYNNNFEIKYEWFQNNKKVEALTSGELAIMKVKVNVKKHTDYASLEIPIPAGCTYYNKPMNASYFSYDAKEMHREYFKDRIVIYFDRIAKGDYEFEFKLEPRFKGKFHINNSLMEHMYFPQLNGFNSLQKIKIN